MNEFHRDTVVGGRTEARSGLAPPAPVDLVGIVSETAKVLDDVNRRVCGIADQLFGAVPTSADVCVAPQGPALLDQISTVRDLARSINAELGRFSQIAG